MTVLGVALRYLRGRRVATTLSAVSIALGVGLVLASLLLTRGIEKAFVEGATDYSLIVGARAARPSSCWPSSSGWTRRHRTYCGRPTIAWPATIASRSRCRSPWATRTRGFATWPRTSPTSPPSRGAARASA